MSGGWTTRRRFWTEAAVAPAGGGWAVLLDGRPLRTPGRAGLVAPSRAAAEACAAEWAAQGDETDPATMPVTLALNTALDRIAPRRAEVAAEIAAYGASDLLCYRAPGPAELAARQAALWDPWLSWARETFDAPLATAVGVVHVAQPPRSLGRLAEAVGARDPFALAALQELTALSGSLVLALAVEGGALAADGAWRISRIDEDWQAERWGVDAEAAEAAARKAADFAAAARLAALLRAG